MHDPPRTRRSALRQSRTRYSGLDGHQEAIAVASVANDHDAEVSSLGAIGTRPCDIDHLVRTRHSNAQHLVFGDAAGPCGYWLSRYLTPKGQVCWVVAPSLMPKKAGDRVHTDRRDAVQLARLMHSGDRTRVSGPSVADEAIRALSRARAAAIRALKAATCRLNACLRRHDLRDPGRATWGPAPLRWLAAVVCPTPAQHIVFHESVRAVTDHTERLQRLEQALHEPVNTWHLQPVVAALQALRGVQFTVAVTMVAALGDLTRFDHPPPLMQCWGLLPSAYATGERRRPGASTNAGHTPARRVLMEGAWA